MKARFEKPQHCSRRSWLNDQGLKMKAQASGSLQVSSRRLRHVAVQTFVFQNGRNDEFSQKEAQITISRIRPL